MRKDYVAQLNTAKSGTKRFSIAMTSPTVLVLIVMTIYPLLFTKRLV